MQHLYLDRIYLIQKATNILVMKKASILFSVCILLLSTIFVSCNDDGYSLGDIYAPRLATVMPLSDNTYYLVLDDGKTMWDATGYAYKPKYNQRVILYYTILDENVGGYDYYIKVRGIQEILTKDIIDLTAQNQDSIGNDPIRILRHWVGDDYLNIEFGYNRGGQKTHYINLVNNTTINNTNNEKVYLEFRHNANGDPQKNGTKGYVAFDLKPYQETGKDSIDFIIKVNDFGVEKDTSFTYYFNKNKHLQQANNVTSEKNTDFSNYTNDNQSIE